MLVVPKKALRISTHCPITRDVTDLILDAEAASSEVSSHFSNRPHSGADSTRCGVYYAKKHFAFDKYEDTKRNLVWSNWVVLEESRLPLITKYDKL